MENTRIPQMNFTLFGDEDEDYKIVFRFYPNRSHCHSFDENPPKTRKDVYKVYYAWDIVFFDSDEESHPITDILFEMQCDECSALFDLAPAIRRIAEKLNAEEDIFSGGQPGAEWTIKHFQGLAGTDLIRFVIWSDPDNKGYRFYLTLNKALKFADYLDEVNNYMLLNGEPI